MGDRLSSSGAEACIHWKIVVLQVYTAISQHQRKIAVLTGNIRCQRTAQRITSAANCRPLKVHHARLTASRRDRSEKLRQNRIRQAWPDQLIPARAGECGNAA